MGSSSSKFRKHLQNGDEVAALNVYNNHSDLRKGLDPNSSYGDNFQNETPLHYAARHGMKSLLRIFLFELGGNPNKTNGRKETALHCVCMEKNPQFYPVQRRRLECLTMLLQWRGAQLKDGEIEKVDLGALDEKSNTGLHYAAASGLKSCVELLVNHGCPLFVENEDNHTPCDCAESSSFNEIALYLESKMVFSNDPTPDEIEEIPPQIDSEEYSGLRAQDLQEAKDQLLVETADMLSIPLFTAEALLRNHEWSREILLDAWMSDPQVCCEKSGVTPPANLFSEKPIVEESLSSPTLTHPPSPFAECDICTQSFQMNEEPVHMPCHQFCRDCWEGYLNVKIKEGGVHDITCPGYECSKLVPVEVIENVVSRDMARRYLQFDIKAFVDSNPNIKWCPYPGCGRAVKLPEVIEGSTSNLTSPRHNVVPSDTSRAVDCGNGHHFCWECMGEAHEPCSCDSLKKWIGEINEIKPEKLDGTEQECENAANCLWLVTNSKPCPNCKSPIQKNEGCNHMKCSKCKYDFCWVCLDQWKRHNSSTGGYFKCNRYEVSKKVDDTSKSAILEAEEKNSKMQELNKFVHYYTRYKNHENSFKFEEPLVKTAKEKMLKLAEAVTDLATAKDDTKFVEEAVHKLLHARHVLKFSYVFATAKDETKFVEEAVHKLLRARRVLKFSYVYGYYLDGPPYRKIVFEFMQTELEECTEILSQMVNRLYLRTPRKKIIDQSQLVHRKRVEFITAISKGLVPPETPPHMRKKRRKYSMDTEDEDLRKAILASIQDVDPENPCIVDTSGQQANIGMFHLLFTKANCEDLRKAILASIEDVDPENPWIVDASGRHTNVAAFLDWPSDDSDDSDSVPLPTTPANVASTSQESPPGHCLRDSCSRRRAKNPRTGEYHNFCSLRCSRLHKQRKEEIPTAYNMGKLDEQMDFLRALEMSRLQYLKEQGGYNEENRSDLTSSGETDSHRSHDQDIYTPAERLDIEIKRLLELSSIDGEGLDDKKKAVSDCSTLDMSDDKPVQPVSRFGENQSTVVSRVPNKSVEDLYHTDCAGCQLGLTSPAKQQESVSSIQDVTSLEEMSLESLGACGGTCDSSVTLDGSEYPGTDSEETELGQMVDSIRIEGKMLQRMLNTDTIDKPFQDILPASATGFGVIKDISVSNIHVDDDDKTKDFLKKDFSGMAQQQQQQQTRTKVVDRGNGRLFAANTPGEDEKVFSLVSPESDFSESSSSEVWGYRPEVVTVPLKEQTPETDSSIDGCSYADLPNQNAHYKHGDSIDEQSPVIGEEIKTDNLIGGEAGAASANQMSIVEMTENLLQMTLEMQEKIDKDLNTQFMDNTEGQEDMDDQVIDFDNMDEFPEPPSGWINNTEIIDNVDAETNASLTQTDTNASLTHTALNIDHEVDQVEETGDSNLLNVELETSTISIETEFTVDTVTNEERVMTIDNRTQNTEQQLSESRSTFV